MINSLMGICFKIADESSKLALMTVNSQRGLAVKLIAEDEPVNKLVKTALSYRICVALRILPKTALRWLERRCDKARFW